MIIKPTIHLFKQKPGASNLPVFYFQIDKGFIQCTDFESKPVVTNT